MPLGRETNDEFFAGSEFLRDLVQRAEARLARLQARKEHIRRRMQALRYLANHARERVDDVAPRSNNISRQISHDEVDRGAIGGSRSSRHISERQSRLRRACRIALMETDQLQSCAQIFQRIEKRGSISFEDYEHPLRALNMELQAMVADAEILCSLINGEMRWGRKDRENAADR